MKWAAFKEAVEILDKYVGPEDRGGVYAVHEQIYAGPEDADAVGADDAKRLMELGWFIEEDSWSCHT